MKTLVEVALSYVGVPYKWGGKTPAGFDCSGLTEEILGSVGVLNPRKEILSAQGIYNEFKGGPQIKGPGALVFYGKSTSEITHVAFMIDGARVVEAGSGDHTTITPADAEKQNAFVRVRPYFHRSDIVAVLCPPYPGWLGKL